MKKTPNVLKDFLNMSHWQTLLIVLALFISFGIIWYVTKKWKLKFQYRILMGLGLGVIIGIAISGGAGFPGKSQFKHPTWGSYEWGYQANQWFGLFSSIFISGLMIMILPIIFLSMARIISKQSKSNIASITWKGIAILLINVAVVFAITFWIGYGIKIGQDFTISEDKGNNRAALKSLQTIITSYMPNNFFAVMGKVVVVPVLVLGSLVGIAIRKSSTKYPGQMDIARKNLDRYWKICISVLKIIIKFMPYAVLTMISSAIFKRPIGEFVAIGELIGLGYLGVIIAYGWQVLTIWIFGISPKQFVKKGYKPVLNGFVTQSSMATLPLAMKTLKVDMNLGEEAAAPDIVMPLSTTLGLTGCAGVQSGVILTLLYNSANSPVTMSVGIFFLLGLIVTLFASLGIAGVPGTATIVTIGIVSTIGFPGFVNGTINIISPLNGIFDMGRTAVNVNGGVQASLITSSLEGELPKQMKTNGPFGPLIKRYYDWKQTKKNNK